MSKMLLDDGRKLNFTVVYKVVATLDTYHVYNGKKYHHDISSCCYNGRFHELETKDKDKALQWLNIAIEECTKFDKESEEKAKHDRNTIVYHHTNIRMVHKYVSDWIE